MKLLETEREILHGHLFCGIGGGAIGFNKGHARVGNVRAKFVCVGGIDVDPASCRDFLTNVGVPASCVDLFTREQYRSFHGEAPPAGWREAQVGDVHAAFGGRRPNIVFLSAPCLPADGLVLTDQGEVEISKVSVGDKVLTHRGRYRRVTAVGCNPYVGDMNAFRLNGTVNVQKFTDEHPMWVRRVVRTGPDKKRRLDEARFMPAKDVRMGDRIGFPIEREVPGTAQDFIENALPGGNGFYLGDEHNDALWFLVGCYLGDGYRRRERPEVIFCPGAEDGDVSRAIKEALDLLGITASIDRDGGESNVKLRITDRTLYAIFGATHGPNAHTSKHSVQAWDDPSKAVTGTDRVGSGALCVADPRPGFSDSTHTNILKVTEWDKPSRTVTGSNHPSGGAGCVADNRAADRYGVLRYDEPAKAVTAHGQHDNGYNSVADPRSDSPIPSVGETEQNAKLPNPSDRLVAVIFALDGTWHRPFTTLELAALQGLVDPEEKFELDGLSDASWRERIGNCIPPPSAQAIAGVMGEALLLAWAGETFTLSSSPIWVRDVAVALSVKPQELLQ